MQISNKQSIGIGIGLGIFGIILFLPKRAETPINPTNPINPINPINQAFQVDFTKPRGERNNNAGNIRISKSNWKGKVPLHLNTDGVFEQFYEKKYGVRALIKLLHNYHKKGLNTVEKIIGRYAPSNENNTKAYVDTISRKLKVKPSSYLSLDKKTMRALATAIDFSENGKRTFDNNTFEQAYQLL